MIFLGILLSIAAIGFFCWLLFTLAVLTTEHGTLNTLHAAAPKPPNILVIVADDLGYADVGFQGCKDIPTPHLDALAKRSVRCTSGYVTHPFCSPTRAGLLTGCYPNRIGIHGALGPKSPQGIADSEMTLAQLLKHFTATMGNRFLRANAFDILAESDHALPGRALRQPVRL